MPESFVQVPANSTGEKLRVRQRTVGANTVDEQFYTVAPDATYYAWTGSIVCAVNQQLFTILNGAAQTLHIEALYLINTATAAVTGVALEFDIKRVSAVTVGTGSSLTLQQAASGDSALSSVTVATKAQTVTEGAVLWPYFTNNDEIGATNAFPTTNIQAYSNLIPDLPNVKKPELVSGEGLTVKQITSSTVGSFGILAVITKAP